MKATLERWSLIGSDTSPVARTSEPALGSLTEIYETYFDFVWRNARRLGVPEAHADDVVQDVFLVVHRRLADFDPRAQLRSWIFGILVRVARDHRRSFRRKGARCVSLEQEDLQGSPAVATEPTPSELTERAERLQLLEQLLDQLGEHHRTLLILSEFEEWSLREMAELFDSNPNTIFSRVRAAKREFDKVYARWLADQGGKP